MSRLKFIVVGTGHLGKIHTKLIQQHPGAELVAVVDPIQANRQAMSDAWKVPAFETCDHLPLDFDAAIIATPTKTHFSVAEKLLTTGKHLLIEKPIAFSTQESQAMVELAQTHRCTVQVGHVERFNPAFIAAKQEIQRVRYVEMQRTSSFTGRSTDIGVVFDLMIHDIDLLLNLVDSQVVDVQALGVSVFGDNEDMAQARITFANGTVANLSASRCSFVADRSLKLYGTNGYVEANLTTRKIKRVCVPGEVQAKHVLFNRLSPEAQTNLTQQLFAQVLPLAELEVPATNAIFDEQADFIQAIVNAAPPQVPAVDGHRALVLAKTILSAIKQHTWSENPFGPRGALVSVDQFVSEETTRRAA